MVPCVMQQFKVRPVVRDKNASLLCSDQKVFVVTGVIQAKVTRCDDVVTLSPKQVGNPNRYVMIGIVGSHVELHGGGKCSRNGNLIGRVGGDARIDEGLVPTIVG